MRRIYTIGAGLTACCLAALTTAPSALAADDDVDVVNTETVQVYVGSDGDVQSQRVYEQLTLTGTGPVSVANPIEEQGLRNLDGFSGFSVEDGVQNVDVDVDGVDRLRSVSDYQGDLPLDISIQYHLDGKLVEPSDIVGADGELEVTYTVKNITAQPQEVTYSDGKGGTVTDTVEVPIPIVGSLSTVAPDNFTEVTSDQANMAGDGKGGTKLSFTMTLFPPLGSDETEFGYTANITDGVVPASSVTALPVNPLESPSFKTAGDSYQSGSETGATLADGATEIDSNLLKLRDGASDLLSGLIQLSDGADELNAGLAGEAAPGSQELADGAGDLHDGLVKIDDGAGQLADGAGRASEGGNQVAAGASDLNDGLGQIDAGAGDLDAGAQRLLAGQKSLRSGLKTLESGVNELPASVSDQLTKNDQYQALLKGMQDVVDGIGNPSDVTNPATGQPATIFGGLNAIRNGLAGQVLPGVQGALAKIPASKARLGCGAAVLTQLAGGAAAPAECGATGLPAVTNPVGPIQDNQRGALGNIASGLATGVTDLEELEIGLSQIEGAITTQFLPGIDKIKGGLNNPGANPNCAVGAASPSRADDCGVQQAVAFFKVSVPQLVDQLTLNISQTLIAGISVPSTGCDPRKPTLLCGAGQLVDGADQLSDGAGRLSAGTGEAKAGSNKLAAGAGDLSSGLGDLSDGADDLAAGTGEASDGSQKLAAGAGDLADGLGDAADGSGRLADGLDEAADGAPQLVDGAERLSDEGMSQLIDAGVDTAQDYGKLYATLAAGAERADTEKMAYGAPEDAAGLTAYTYELLGDDGENGRNTERGLGALVLLGLGGGAFALRRRLA